MVAGRFQVTLARVTRQPLNGPIGQAARRPLRLAGRPRLGEMRDPAPDLIAEKVHGRAGDGRQARADDSDGALETAPE